VSIQPFSPYHYVDLDPKRWQTRLNELLNAAAAMPDRRAADAWVQDELNKNIISELYRFPENELSSVKASEVPKDICVIGGGIAGLTAAYELANKGNKVHLLEASSRLGGRMRTHHFDSNTYGELGAMRIPANHGCVWHYINHFKLTTREFVSHNIDAYLFLREGRERLRDFANLQKLFNLRPPGRNCNGRSPFDAAEEFIQHHMGTLTVSDFKSIFQEFYIPPELRELEQFSLGQLMRGDHPSGFGYFGPDACEYLGRGTGMLWFDQASCLQFILNELALKEPNKDEIVGGMVRLIESFRKALTERAGIVELNCAVTGVEIVNKSKVRVTWRTSRGERQGEFDYVVCATPAGATLRLRFTPPLAPQVYEALTNISYASSGKTIIRADHRFWEKDGIFGGGSYTDLANQQIWYPSDNSDPAPDADVRFGYGGSKPRATKRVAKQKQLADRPAVFTAAYMWGANARRFAALESERKTELILSCVEKVHPGCRAFIKDANVVHHSWDEQESPGHGAFAFFAPGEQSRYQRYLCEPHPFQSNAPQVFFAGEHLAICHAWIQNAIQSALSTVLNILSLR
jgi:monoamine oxidase